MHSIQTGERGPLHLRLGKKKLNCYYSEAQSILNEDADHKRNMRCGKQVAPG